MSASRTVRGPGLQRPDPPAGAAPSRLRRYWLAVLPVVGIGLLLASYRLAASEVGGHVQVHLFWVGFFLVMGPVAWLLLARPTSGLGRTALLAAAGLAAYVPHFLRAPTRPYMNDELAHYLQAQQLYATGQLFKPNPIVQQAANFPGFETLTVALRGLTGMGTYQVGVLIIAAMHVATVLGVYQFARVAVDGRVACIAGLMYAIGPQFGVVDSLYAYESFGLPLFILALAAAATASAQARRGHRTAWLSIAAVLTLACIFTHHLSSYVLLVGLLVLCIGWAAKPAAGVSRTAVWALLSLFVAGTALAIGWAYVRDANTYSYLTVYVRNDWQSLVNTAAGTNAHQESNGYVAIAASRTPLSSADIPIYERIATFAAQFVLLALAAAGFWRRRRTMSAPWLFAVVLSVLYFVSLPLLISAGGQNAAHRSWAFSYLGLSVTVALGVDALLSWRSRAARVGGGSVADSYPPTDDDDIAAAVPARTDRAAHRPLRPGRDASMRRRLAVVGIVLFLLCGAWGAGVNTLVAFPGKFVFQSDGRNVPHELYDLADWMRVHEGTGKTVLADYRTSVILTTIGEEHPSTRLASQLVLPEQPSAEAIAATRATADFVVIDRRLTTDVSSEGYYFWGYEQLAEQPLPAQRIDKLHSYPWLRQIRRTDHYTVYQVSR